MLRDGQYIREAPLKLSVHYIPKKYPSHISKEEQFAQNILLGIAEQKLSILSRVFGFLLRM